MSFALSLSLSLVLKTLVSASPVSESPVGPRPQSNAALLLHLPQKLNAFKTINVDNIQFYFISREIVRSVVLCQESERQGLNGKIIYFEVGETTKWLCSNLN